MNGGVGRAVPGWYWAVAVLAVAWEAFGAYIYTSQSLIDHSAREGGYATMASWQWGVFAVAVWSGLLGAIALLLRKRWAVPLLLLSLVAAAFQYGYAATQGTLESADMPVAVSVLVVGLLLVVFSSYAKRRGWLG